MNLALFGLYCMCSVCLARSNKYQFYSLWFATTGARTHDLPHSIDNIMAKRKRTNHDLQNTTRKTKNCATRISLKKGKGWKQVLRKGKQFLFHCWHSLYYSCYKLSDVMNEERTGLWLHQKEHICGHLWHRYYLVVNQVMVVIDINETCFDQIS